MDGMFGTGRKRNRKHNRINENSQKCFAPKSCKKGFHVTFLSMEKGYDKGLVTHSDFHPLFPQHAINCTFTRGRTCLKYFSENWYMGSISERLAMTKYMRDPRVATGR